MFAAVKLAIAFDQRLAYVHAPLALVLLGSAIATGCVADSKEAPDDADARCSRRQRSTSSRLLPSLRVPSSLADNGRRQHLVERRG
jgi:hypothetical protein